MSFTLTKRTQDALNNIGKEPQAILDIEGIDLLFGMQPVLTPISWDDGSSWDTGLRWDSNKEDPKSRDWISTKDTTSSITQQLAPDKGSASSISIVNISMVDKNGELSKVFALSNVTEILGKKADFYIGFASGSHPADSIPVFRGVIVDYYTDAGKVNVSVAHPDTLKRQSIFEEYTGLTTQYIKYKELDIQDLRYKQRSYVTEEISIEYVTGSPLAANYDSGSDTLTVTLPASTKAADVQSIIQNTGSTNAVVTAEIIGNPDNIQNTFSSTPVQTDTQITVESTDNFIESSDALTSYIRINDEVMEVASVDSATQFTVVRERLNTVPESHDSGSDVASIYRLQGLPLELSLKLMHSKEGNEFFVSDEIIESFVFVSITESIPNAIIFSNPDIETDTGLVSGDSVKITGSTSNDGTYTISGFQQLEDGRSVIIVNETLVSEETTAGAFEFKSKYNVLNEGLGMLPFQVDTEGFEEVETLFLSNFVAYDFKLIESIEGKEFIEKEIFFPQALYAIPRKARASVKFTSPPLSSTLSPTLNTENILNPQKVKQRRSIHKYYYNRMLYKFNYDIVQDKLTDTNRRINTDSLNRFNVGKKRLTVEASGLTRSTSTDQALSILSSRIIDRYKYAARYFDSIELDYKTGFNIEVGDIVYFGGSDLQYVNLESGGRDMPLESFEVYNKQLNIINGKVKVNLVETGFGISGRFGRFSPSSYVATGSTTTRLLLSKFLDIGEVTNERDKWDNFVGTQIRVRSEDYTFDYTVTLDSFDNTNKDAFFITPALPSAPLENYIIEFANYDSLTSVDANEKAKRTYTWNMNQVEVSVSNTAQSFDIDDTTGYFDGQLIQIHSDDFTSDSVEVRINTIVGNTVTLESAVSFTPQVGDKLEALEFTDGDGYRFL